MKMHLIVLFILVQSCGKPNNTTNNTLNTNLVKNNQKDYGEIYNSMSSAKPNEFSYSWDEIVIGYEKHEGSLICRKFNSGGVLCWENYLSGDEAKNKYNSIIDPERAFVLIGFYGSGTMEKESSDSLCQKVTGAYPMAVPSFTCLKPY